MPYIDGERLNHFSVYDGGLHYYSKVRRMVGFCEMKQGALDCCCCCRKHYCVHKALCLLHVLSQNKLYVFRRTAQDQDIFLHDEIEQISNSNRKPSMNIDVIYPSEDSFICFISGLWIC